MHMEGQGKGSSVSRNLNVMLISDIISVDIIKNIKGNLMYFLVHIIMLMHD